MRAHLLLVLLVFVGLGGACDTGSPSVDRLPIPSASQLAQEFAGPAKPLVEAPHQAAAAVPRPADDPVDPYEGWGQRCEPLDGARSCETSKDCAEVTHPSGRPLRCIRPYWSTQGPDGKWSKVCSPGWSTRSERRWRRARLEEIVQQQYFGHSSCVDDGRPGHEQPWRCQRQRNRGATLSKFLWLIYQRETTGRPWKRHRLNGDVRVARTDWFRQAPRYGWWAEPGKRGAVESVMPCVSVPPRKGEPKKLTACRDRTPSKHFMHQYRWSYGLGPYGQIAALWVAAWDPLAPPEILCGEVEPTETYLRGARRAWKKLRGGIRCAGELYQPDPTWADIHRAVAAGKLCPDHRERAGFRRRAARVGLDPDQHVSLTMLGTPIARDGQNERAAELYARLDMVLPWPDSSG